MTTRELIKAKAKEFRNIKSASSTKYALKYEFIADKKSWERLARHVLASEIRARIDEADNYDHDLKYDHLQRMEQLQQHLKEIEDS